MDNFLFGLSAVVTEVMENVRLLFYSPLVRGFFSGAVVATLVYGLLVVREARTQQEICPPTDTISWKLMSVVKILFAVAVICFLLLLFLMIAIGAVAAP